MEINNSFLNSLFIEAKESSVLTKKELNKIYPMHSLADYPYYLVISGEFIAGITSYSRTFQNKYGTHFYQNDKPLNYQQWKEKLVLSLTNKNDAEIFLKRIKESEENTALAFKNKSTLKSLDFKTSESSLLSGHYAHPYPKLKEIISDKNLDHLLDGEVSVRWLLVKREYLHFEGNTDVESQLINMAFAVDAFPKNTAFNEYLPFPMHSLQWELLKDKLQGVIDSKTSTPFHATTSLRTLYRPDTSWMLKFSLSVRLTNSIRHLKIHEVRRGMMLGNLSSESLALKLHPDFKIIQEPFFLALKDKSGAPMEETVVVFRHNPFKNENESNICLAVLTQELPGASESLILNKLKEKNQDKTKWFSNFLQKVLAPLISLQADDGILLGAHQQNIILNLDDDYQIQKTYYRDTQGSGLVREFAQGVSEDAQNIIPMQIAQTLLGYYLFVNTTLGLIHALSENCREENFLIHQTTDFLLTLRNQKDFKDQRFLDYILNSPKISVKNNFRCSIQNQNENAMDNPFSLYQNMTNPFYRMPPMQEVYTQTNGVTHPLRPAFKEGETLYQNKVPRLNKTISLGVIDRNLDLDTFHNWQNQERVAFFWELNKSKPEIFDYISKCLNGSHLMPVIVKLDDESVGYFEIYWTKEDRLGPYYEAQDYDRGFHLLIGNEKFLGFENTDAILKHVCHYIFQSDERTKSIMGEPRHDNQKILRYVETFKAWERIKEFDFPHKRAVLLRCDREKFYQGDYI